MVQYPDTGTPAPVPAVQQPFDVFLSHSRRDSDVVERVALFLKRERVEPWLDAWCLTAGRSWQEGMAAGLAASRCCAVFIGPEDLGAWVREEVELAMDIAVRRRGFRVFPVLLPGVDPLAPGALPPFLGSRMWVDMRDGPQDPRGRDQLLAAIRGTPLGPSVPVEPREDVVPYRGLHVFEEEDASFFFGRERDVQRLLERLRGARFVALLGASGSGKSSLARAGLVPALRAGRLPGSETWPLTVVRPGSHPVEALASAVAKLDATLSLERVVDDLARGERGLHLAVQYMLADRPPDARAVIVVDQLEEAFTLCEDARERTDAFANLVYAATRPGGRCIVIVTLRADFYARLAAHPSLAQLVESGHELVGPLGDDGLRAAIEGPAQLAGLVVQDGLADAIIADAGPDAGALPLLEHALLETWNHRHAGALTLAGYRRGGGVQGALAQRAQTVFDDLTPPAQELARRVLLQLIQPGDGVPDTRRRALLDELVGGGPERPAVEAVIADFARERLLTTDHDASGRPCVEIAHEALIRSWPRLRIWIDEDRLPLKIIRRLTEAARDWDRLAHDPGVLYRGAQLREAADVAGRDDLGPLDRERTFLAASAERERRERRAGRLRRALLAGSAAAVLLVAGMLARPQVERYVLRHEALGASPQVTIPAGVAILGGSGDRARVELSLPGFAIDRHEVSNRQYRLCVRADRCAEPVTPSGMPTYLEAPADLPVVNVTAVQAAAFCRFLGRRLPTDAEWERAARGPHGRRWPWGDDPPTPARANLDIRGVKGALAAVDAAHFAQGRSAEGVAEMAGNASEWTSTPAACTGYRCRPWDGRSRVRALWSRGRGWLSGPAPLSGDDAFEADPSVPEQDQGFRCAEDTE